MQRIIALAVPENIASRKVMEHCGLKYIQSAHMFDLDLVYYALPRADYIETANLHESADMSFRIKDPLHRRNL